MYLPKSFEPPDPAALPQFVREHPFGVLVTMTSTGLDGNHLPFLIDPDAAPYGTLRDHVARANPLWRECQGGANALVIFQGPHSFISPSWYPSKQETGAVVPTWNYVVVHAHGTVRVVEDADWLRRHVEALHGPLGSERRTRRLHPEDGRGDRWNRDTDLAPDREVEAQSEPIGARS